MSRYLIILLFFVFTTGACADEWFNYTSGKWATAITHYGDSIWVGTKGGLVLINNKNDSVIFFNKTNSKLVCTQITSVATDSNGSLYLGGLWFQEFTNTGNTKYLERSYVSEIVISEKQTVYCGWGLFLHIFNGTEWDSVKIGSDFSSKFIITSVLVEDTNRIWVGTNEGLFIVDETHVLDTVLPFENITSLVKDKTGKLFAGTSEKGIKIFNGVGWETKDTTNSGIPDNTIYCMAFDSKGDLWTATKKGVGKYNGTNWIIYNSLNSGLPEDITFTLEIDKHDNVWVGMMNSGVTRFEGTNWKQYNTSNSLLYNGRCFSLITDQNNSVWLGDGGGILQVSNMKWIRYDTSSSNQLNSMLNLIYTEPGWNVWSGNDLGLMLGTPPKSSFTSNIDKPGTNGVIKRDKNGTIWMALEGSLWKFDGLQWAKLEMGLFPNNLKKIDYINTGYDGTLYISAQDSIKGYLLSSDGTRWQTIYTCDPYFLVSATAIDKLNNVWVGSLYRFTAGVEYGKGLLKFDGQKWQQYTISNSGLPSNSVCDLAFDSAGALWVGTIDGGFTKYDCANNWTVYDWMKTPLTDNTVEHIAIDNNGYKWLATQFGGLCVFKEGIVAIGNPNKKNEVKNPFKISVSWTTSMLRICYPVINPAPVIIRIVDLRGKTIQTLENSVKNTGTHHINMNCKNIAKGIYFIHTQIDKNISATKIITTR